MLDISYQRVKRLFVLAYDNTEGANRVTADSHRKYFLPREKLKITTLKLLEEIFVISQLITQLNNTTKSEKYQQDKVMIDYTTGCLLDFAYFEKNYKLIAADLSKQKALDADPRGIQQIVFTGKVITNVIIYYILEQSKETTLQFSKGTTKVL